MAQYLFQEAIAERGDSRRFSVHPQLRDFYDEYVRGGVRRLLINTPPVYDIKNIANYIRSHEPGLVNSGTAAVTDADDGFDVSCPQLNKVCHLYAMPLLEFEQGGCWMEQAIDQHASDADRRRAWYVFRAQDSTAGGEHLDRPLVLVEFVGSPSRGVSVDVVVRMELADDGTVLPTMHFWAPDSDDRSNRAMVLSRMIPEYSVRVAPVLMALCVLRSTTGFSKPYTEAGRTTIMRRIGIQTHDAEYMFEDGPRMRHFVRGHFRVYRQGREVPLTTWVVPHTRGSRRSLLPAGHRRRLTQLSGRDADRSQTPKHHRSEAGDRGRQRV